MLSPSIFALLIFVLGTCSVGGLMPAALYPRLARGTKLDRRIALISAAGETAILQRSADDEHNRKRTVEDTLREAEEKLSAKSKRSTKPSLLIRMQQAQLSWSKNTYYLVCVGSGMAVSLFMLTATGLGMLPGIGFGISGGLLLPNLYVSFRRNRRFKRFVAEFPDAVDVIVRGVKVGLPLIDCLKIIATEAREPVKGEFKLVIEDQTLGMPLEEAVQRLPERIPLSEASFFAIVIAIQSRTGGSLSEALGNLSKVLRERKKMKAKIKSMSAEAKASGGIIGALPVLVAGLVYLTSPQYIALLFTTLTGNLVLAACAVWMLIGTMVMRKMINFDI